MNRVFITGRIAQQPVLRKEQNDVSHLILQLKVLHKTSAGEIRSEFYPVNAWHNVAMWGSEHLEKGQIIGVHGYLSQRKILAGNIQANSVEITADEFLLMNYSKFPEKTETANIPIA